MRENKVLLKMIYGGRYTTLLEAKKQYNRLAKEHFGKFAVLHEITEEVTSARTDSRPCGS